MNDDDELCLCFHVTKRKVIQYIRARRPRVASQLSECYGAGTGCGWCRPFLRRLMETAGHDDTPRETGLTDAASPPTRQPDFPDAAAYAAARTEYREEKNRNE